MNTAEKSPPLEIIRKHLNQFLHTELPEVLTLKGQWGTGKTFYWKKVLKEEQQAKKIKLTSYAYISLFGINSITELKSQIFANSEAVKDIGNGISLQSLQSNQIATITAFTRKHLPALFSKGQLSNYAFPFDVIVSASLGDKIICIDDLERVGKNLSIKEIMGFVSLLKEQHKCKVVILVNASEEGLGDYEKYREKVVDFELAFAPTSIECANIAINKTAPWSDACISSVAALDIRNIRIINKIDNAIKQAWPFIEHGHDEMKIHVIKSLTLFIWANCNHTHDAVPLEFIAGKSVLGRKSFKENTELVVEQWETLLNSYGYITTDALDEILINFVHNGYINEPEFRQIISKKRSEWEHNQKKDAINDAWALFTDSFDDNQNEFVEKIHKTLLSNMRYAGLNSVIPAFTILNQLGELTKANEIVAAYITENKGRPNAFQSTYTQIPNELKALFSEHERESYTAKSLKDILIDIERRNGWSQRDVETLCNASESDFYKLFMSTCGDELRACIKSAKLFGDPSKASDSPKTVSQIAHSALMRIASEQEFNRIRLERWGIIPTTSSTETLEQEI